MPTIIDGQRFWRTLVRVSRVYPREILVIVPGWDTQQELRVTWDGKPPFENLEPGDRLHAKVNIGARFAEDVEFYDWEPC